MCIALYKIKENCDYSFSSFKILEFQNIEKSKQFLLLFFIVYLLKPFPCIGEHGLEHNGVLFKKIFKIVPEKNRKKNTSKISDPSSLYCWVLVQSCMKSWKEKK